ncbi:MAG: amino acid ABC transporter substrate-binding protein [Dehalococcoidales bacterium]
MWNKGLKYTLPIMICLVILIAVIPGCTKQAASKDTINVGMARSLSGPLATISNSAFVPVYKEWMKEVNDAGGINVGGKMMKIKLTVYDDKSDAATLTQLTEKLILEDKVDFLWPACGTAMLFAQAPIANKYNKVLITAEGGATSLEPMLPSMPYIFVTLSFSDWYEMPVLADMLQAKGVKTAYITYISDLHGIEYNSEAGIEFGRVGIQILGTKALPPDIKDLSPVIKEAKASNADAFMCFAYPDQIMPAVGTSMELSYNPKVWLGGPGVNFGFFHTTFGAAVEGVTGWAAWERASSPALNTLADKLYTGQPEDVQDWWGACFYWAGLDMWKAAIEKAGTLDNTKVMQVLKSQHMNTVLGDTWFENGLMAKQTHPGEVGQWVNGVYHIVGPASKAHAQFEYPKPAWPAPASK